METTDKPVGCAEIASLLGRKPGTIHMLHHQGKMPPRDFTVGGRAAWWWQATIVPWAQRTGRLENEDAA